MTMNNPTVEILSTRTSERGTTTVPTLVLTDRQVNLKVFTHVRDVTVLVTAVGALVPLVITSKAPGTFSEVAMHPILVTVIDGVLHALITVRAYDVFRPLLANARGVDPTYLELKVHVGQRFACVGERNLLVAVLAMDDLGPAAVPAQSLFHIAFLVHLVAPGTLSHVFRSTLLARDDIERLVALALHTKLDKLGRDFDIPLERVAHKPILHVVVDHCIQTPKSLFKGYHTFLHVQLKRNITVNLHRRGNDMCIALGFTTRALLHHMHTINTILGRPTRIALVKSFS